MIQFLFTFISIICLTSASYAIESLPDLFERELDKPIPTFDQSKLQVIQKYQFVFNPGFLNEISQTGGWYFTTAERLLKKWGIPLTRLSPKSIKHYADNLPYISKTLRDLYKKDERPIIIIGHSLGGLILNHALLYDWKLFHDGIVHIAVPTQAPLRGTQCAQRHKQGCIMRTFRYFCPRPFNSMCESEVQSQSEKLSHQFEKEMNEYFGDLAVDKIREYSARTLIVRSTTRWEDMSWSLKASSYAYQKPSLVDWFESAFDFEDDQDDGVLHLSEQTSGVVIDKIPFGVNQDPLKADHVQLFLGGPFSSSTIKFREAYFHALMNKIVETLSELEKK